MPRYRLLTALFTLTLLASPTLADRVEDFGFFFAFGSGCG
jgi:hypothetical protein